MVLRGSVFSTVLGMNTGITVVSPAGHGGGRPYQIAYVLHGLCGNSTDVVDYTMLPAYANKYHCIFVLPEVGRSFYQDMVFGQDFFRYVAEELPQICRDVFNLSARREDTFVMGLSMGGYGALRCALSKPEQYGACCALAPGCLFLEDFLPQMRAHAEEEAFIEEWGEQFIGDFRAAFGTDFAPGPNSDLLRLAAALAPKEAPRLYAACGNKDGMLEMNRDFAQRVKKLGHQLAYEELPGGHDWDFFNRGLKRAAEFCCREGSN